MLVDTKIMQLTYSIYAHTCDSLILVNELLYLEKLQKYHP